MKVANRNNISRYQIVILLFLFLLLILISELIFIVIKRPAYYKNYLTDYHLKRAQHFAKKSDVNGSLYHLNKAAEVKIEEVVSDHPDLDLEDRLEVISLPNDGRLKDSVGELVLSLDRETLREGHAYDFARIYYSLGLSTYRSNYPETAKSFWESAIILDPELSYYHVELANLHFFVGDSEKASDVLEYCSKFRWPANHCQEFKEEFIDAGNVSEVGFMEETIKLRGIDL